MQIFDSIPEKLIPWLLEQKIFWVATAPLDAEGHVNVSPKGMSGTFHVENATKVWYEDLSGSGIETVSHIRENKRITVMFSAFEGPPNIVRLFGKGSVHEFGTPEYSALIDPEKRMPASRAVIVVDIYQVTTSCGYAVPYMVYSSDRTILTQRQGQKEILDKEAEVNASDPFASKAQGGIKEYWVLKNTKSLDGLTGLVSAQKSSFSLTGYGVSGAEPSATLATTSISTRLIGIKDFVICILVCALAASVYTRY